MTDREKEEGIKDVHHMHHNAFEMHHDDMRHASLDIHHNHRSTSMTTACRQFHVQWQHSSISKS